MEIIDASHCTVCPYPALEEQYIRDANGFILTYSATEKTSLEFVRDIQQKIKKVKSEIHSNSGYKEPWPTVLVRGRCDLDGSQDHITPIPPGLSSGNNDAELWNATHSRLYNLPMELVYMIAQHLDEYSPHALALSSRRFYYSGLLGQMRVTKASVAGYLLAKEHGWGFVEISTRSKINVEKPFHDIIHLIRQHNEARPQAETQAETRKPRKKWRRNPCHLQ